MKQKKSPTMVQLMIEQNQRIDRMETAFAAIIMNLIRHEPSVFRSGVLANCELALGKERYDYYVGLYS
jgi:hypothetical protein